MSKEAMKLALEALAEWKEVFPDNWDAFDEQAITALREALEEQPAQQEPVAWRWKHGDGCWQFEDVQPRSPTAQPLYTSPPAQRKPLTDMQVDGEWILVRDLDTNDVEKSRLFARAIEAAHGIKENT